MNPFQLLQSNFFIIFPRSSTALLYFPSQRQSKTFCYTLLPSRPFCQPLDADPHIHYSIFPPRTPLQSERRLIRLTAGLCHWPPLRTHRGRAPVSLNPIDDQEQRDLLSLSAFSNRTSCLCGFIISPFHGQLSVGLAHFPEVPLRSPSREAPSGHCLWRSDRIRELKTLIKWACDLTQDLLNSSSRSSLWFDLILIPIF